MTAAARKSRPLRHLYPGLDRVPASIRTSTRSMPNMMRHKPISAVRPMPVGHWFVLDMTTAAFPADQPTALPCSSSSLTFEPTGSMSLSSIKSIA